MSDKPTAATSTGSAPLPLAHARALVVEAVREPLDAESVAVGDALGRVLAEDLQAAVDVPAFPNSAMDGFAVRAGAAGRELRIVDESRAGHPASREVAEGEAIRISTGAPLPAGATSVVPVEHASERDGVVTLHREAAPDANVRHPGEDVRAGSPLLGAGTVLGAGELGVAVAAGRDRLRCTRRPRLAVLATGDELAPPGATLGPGQIHNSNAVTLAALATQAGAEMLAADIVPDDPQTTGQALAGALDRADVVVISGGVSVGPHDHVKPALDALGVQERFWRVALKPGKPVWFGTRGQTLVFGLPGNPVSAVVCFLLFAAPALRALQGARPLPPARSALLGQDVRRTPDREQAVRVTLDSREDGELVAIPTGPQGSHILSSLVGADALALIAPGDGTAPAGSRVPVEPLRP